MLSQTNEQALESYIEKRLTGKCLEELKEENIENALGEREEIIRGGKVGIPGSAQQLVSLLDKKSPTNKSDPKSLQ